MAKGPTFSTITAAFASASKLNANNAEITTAFTNTLSRDGSSPNTMTADFDMNSNDILNANDVNAVDIIVGGVSLITQVDAAASSATASASSATDSAASAVTSEASAVLAAQDITRNEIATTTIDSSIDLIRTSGFAAVGDQGETHYKRVGSEPSHNLKVQSLDNAWWELVEDNGVISFIACGGIKGDSAANGAANVTAFNDFIGYAQTFNFSVDPVSSSQTAAPTLLIPMGNYHFNNHLNVKAGCHITGESAGGIAARGGTTLEWPAEKHGFIFHRDDTIDITTEAAGDSSKGSSLQRLHLRGGGNTGAVGSGVWMRTNVSVKDIDIDGFAEHGIKVEAAVGGGASTKGNANLWRLENVTAASNGGHGLFVDLSDANVGLIIGGDFHDNARWGVYASESFGSTYIGVHTAGNGTAGKGGNVTGSSSYVTFGGQRYSAHISASEADLVATEPGTDETVWIDTTSGGSTSQIPTWLVSQSEGTYFHGGPFRTEGGSNQTVFLGCYRETNQGAVQIQDPAIAIGGLMEGNRGTGLQIDNMKFLGKVSFPNHETHFETSTRNITLDVNPLLNKILRVTTEGDSSAQFTFLQWDETDKAYYVCRHATKDPSIRITTDLSTGITGGRTSALPGGSIMFANGIWVGSSKAKSRHHTTDNAVPSTGEHARGDITWNRDLSAGAVLGWVCTVTGDPGTFVEIRGIGTQQSAITDANVAHDINVVFSDVEVETALDILGTRINSLIAAMEQFGLVAT